MAAKKKARVVETTISTIITSKIAELELLECSCTTSQNELGEEELVKCDRCKQIEYWKTHCVCGVCRECINLLLEHYQSLPCECTYKTIKVEETVINPDTGLEETVMVDKQVVDVQCGRCKKIDELEKTLERYNILEKAYIDEKIWHLCKVDLRSNEITVPNDDVAKPSDIEILKDESSNILSSTLDLDFRLMEVEFAIVDIAPPASVNYNLLKNLKGSVNMTPYEMMYTLILADNYERADFEYKISVYVKRGRMTQEEADKLIAMMDAKELVPIKK